MTSTAWSEQELRRLQTDRDVWRARWHALKVWAPTRLNGPALAAVEQMMGVLEAQAPHMPLGAVIADAAKSAKE